MKTQSGGIILAVLSATLAVTLQVGVCAQSSVPHQGLQAPRPVIDDATYNSVLDIVFPRDEPFSGRTAWSIVLRFKPNAKPESQIVIRSRSNKVEIIQYMPTDGSVYNKLNEVLEQGGRQGAVDLARSISVSRRDLSVPHAKVKRWYSTLFDSIAGTTKSLRETLELADNTGVESVVLHGSVYDLWYSQGLKSMSFSLYDVDVSDARSSAELKIVQWMVTVQRDVQKLKQ
jgi:hypothetical protein